MHFLRAMLEVAKTKHICVQIGAMEYAYFCMNGGYGTLYGRSRERKMKEIKSEKMEEEGVLKKYLLQFRVHWSSLSHIVCRRLIAFRVQAPSPTSFVSPR